MLLWKTQLIVSYPQSLQQTAGLFRKHSCWLKCITKLDDLQVVDRLGRCIYGNYKSDVMLQTPCL